jgi:hypothetical protein
MQKKSCSVVLVAMLATVFATSLLSGCSPQYNWRDYRSLDAPYTVLFPGKPESYTRAINLEGGDVNMTMTATEVDHNTFAVGSATMADAGKAQAALTAMKTALVRNIGGKIDSEKAVATAGLSGQASSIDLRAHGARNGAPIVLAAHFAAQGQRIYQVIVVGDEKTAKGENIDMFLNSFKLN